MTGVQTCALPIYPGCANLAQVQRWKGARPMLPDGAPVLGASGAPGVWLNLGHGSSGWALSCGSARVLADQVGGRAPVIDVSGLDIGRLGGRLGGLRFGRLGLRVGEPGNAGHACEDRYRNQPLRKVPGSHERTHPCSF